MSPARCGVAYFGRGSLTMFGVCRLISMMGLMLVIWAFVPRNRVQMK